MDVAFGPVPSRRLGQSLGVNNVPAKTCSYSCVYCQLGPTKATVCVPRSFRRPESIVAAVRRRIERLQAHDERLDYITFVPDGEPTLDKGLGREIRQLKELGFPVAVISNASLIDLAAVRADLCAADLVSVKIDTVSDVVWRRINRPDPSLDLMAILGGLRRFAAAFGGALLTETMLVRGLNDDEAGLTAVADFVAELNPAMAYLSYPTRPPTETWVKAPTEDAVARAFSIFRAARLRAELLQEAAAGPFGFTGDATDDLLAACAVHPMREDEVRAFLAKAGAEWSLVETLLRNGRLRVIKHCGQQFFVHLIRAED